MAPWVAGFSIRKPRSRPEHSHPRRTGVSLCTFSDVVFCPGLAESSLDAQLRPLLLPWEHPCSRRGPPVPPQRSLACSAGTGWCQEPLVMHDRVKWLSATVRGRRLRTPARFAAALRTARAGCDWQKSKKQTRTVRCKRIQPTQYNHNGERGPYPFWLASWYPHTATPGSFKRTPGSFQRTPGSFQRTPGSFKRTPGSFQRTPRSF